MDTENLYPYLEPRPCSAYQQPYIKGTRIRVEIPYSATVAKIDDDGSASSGSTPEEVAADYNIPVEAVLDAIDWCRKHWDVVMADHAAEERLIEAHGMNHPDYKSDPNQYYKPLTVEERNRIDDNEHLRG